MRPDSNQIQPISPASNQYGHTIKHLYSTNERWDLAVPNLPDCRAEARAAGCTDRVLDPTKLHAYDHACPECRTQVVAHHDRFYAPAYFSAVKQSRESLRVEDKCTGFVGKNGVLAIVSKAWRVRTAYRVAPVGSFGGGTHDDFVEAAQWQLHDLAMRALQAGESKMKIKPTSDRSSDIDMDVLLQKFREGTLTAAQAYRLLVLLGRRAQQGTPTRELEKLLAKDELSAAVSALLSRVQLPDSNELLDKLRLELSDNEDPQGALFGSLIDIDNLGTLWELSGQCDQAQKMLRRATAQIVRFPDRVQLLAAWALRRLSTIQTASAIPLLWQAISQETSVAEAQPGLWHRLLNMLDWAPVAQALQPQLAAPRVQVESYGRSWFDCYQEGDELIVQVVYAVGQHVRGTPRLWINSAAATRSIPVRLKLEKPDSVWLSLGTEQQLTEALARVRAELGGDAADIESISLELELEDADVQPQS